MSAVIFIQNLYNQHQQATTSFPDKELAEEFIDKFFNFIF